MPDPSLDALRRATTHAFDYLSGLGARPVGATTTLEDLRARLGVALGDRGVAPGQVIDELVAATEGGHLGSAGGRFFAWVMGGALPAALAADWLASAWDNNAALYACGPAAARPVRWASWQPLVKANEASAGNPSRSLSQAPATSSTTAAAGPQA